MIMHLTVRRPKPDQEEALLAEMRRFSDKVRGHAGNLGAHTLRDTNSGVLVEVAVWANKEAYLVSLPHMEQFENLAGMESEPPKIYHLEEI